MKRTGVGDGFLLVDKPGGWTSHDVVARVRRLLGGKVGHAGTLDPMATGLLVLGLGRSTRLLRFVQGFEKEYRATALLGVATDSLDADGAVLSRTPLPVDREDVEAAAERFVGPIMQVPPMVSARKIGGKRLYELARAGKIVEREARAVVIHRLTITDFAPSDYPEVTFDVVCSTGTYVRALAEDLAGALGGHAHLTRLRRIRNGSLSVDEAVSIDDVEAAVENGSVADVLLPPARALADLPVASIDPVYERGARNGATIPVEAIESPTGGDGDLVRLTAGDTMIGVYRINGPAVTPEVVTA